MAARLGHEEPLYVGVGLVYRMGVRPVTCLELLLLVAGCGGGTPGPAAPTDENPAGPVAGAEESKPRGAGRARRAARVTCEDGSCFSCGEAACLTGFYCAVNPRGHGCAWTPSCATKVTCACLAPSLRETPGCQCEEKDGGVYVSCDGATL
jgi:hypothetical protein